MDRLFTKTYHRNHTLLDTEELVSALLTDGANLTEIDVPIAAIARYVEALERLLEVEEKEAFHDLLLQIKTRWMDDEPEDWNEHWVAKN